MSGRAIFRETALDAYRRGQDRDVIPRLTSRPVIIGSWLLLAMLFVLIILVWLVRVPSYVGAPGIILPRHAGPAQGASAPIAALFVSPDEMTRIRRGLTVEVQTADVKLDGMVSAIEGRVSSPEGIRRRYGRDGLPPDLISGPSAVILVRLHPAESARSYGGSSVTGEIAIGWVRLLSLLPQIGQALSGSS